MRKRLDELFEAVRESCSRPIWSRGVELSRSGTVQAETASRDQVDLRVKAQAETLSRNVILDLAGCDWSCDCSHPDDVCVHVAGGIIAYRRAKEEGKDLPAAAARTTVTVGYRFRRGAGGLLLGRVLVQGGVDRPLGNSLAALQGGRIANMVLLPSQADLDLEVLLGTRRDGWYSREALGPIFARLSECADVKLDGEPVRVVTRATGAIVLVEDQADGFRLSVVQDPSISELFENGVVRCGGELKLLEEPKLTAREMAELRPGRHFGPDGVSELVGEILPSLARRLPVENRSERLPKAVHLPLHLELEVEQEAGGLSVLPVIAYGDPPNARLVGDRLIHQDGPLPIRDPSREAGLGRRLREELGLEAGKRVRFRGGEAIELAERLRDWDGRVRGSLDAFTVAPALVPSFEVGTGNFSVSFSAGGEKGRGADTGAVLDAWRRGETLVPLLGGGYSPLPADWLERFGHQVADLLAARGEEGELPTCMLPDLAKLGEELNLAPPPGFEKLRPLIENFEGLREAELPADLRATLRGYQHEGVAWLAFLQEAGLGGLLADDMGLGKTLQTLCVLEGGSLVVAPTSVLHNWKAEIERFRPGLRITVYHGPERRLEDDDEIVLTTYAILRLDAEALGARKWKTVVLDEAQAIKNPESQVAQAAFRLLAENRICLSGTPVENRLEELWSQFHFLNRGLLGGRKDFQERYAKPIAEGQPGAAARLRRRIRPFVLRRLKSEVAQELPPRTDVVLRCTLSESEQRLYDAVRAAAMEEVVEKLQMGGSVMAALEALLRLRQAACHPALVPGQKATSSSKIDLLLERLGPAMAEGHKALVFSQWTGLLDKVEPHLQEAGIPFLRLDGSTADRGAVVSAFQAEGGPPVLLASLKAGGTGLNLTAADHVFLLDPWWNPAAEDQAADRAHRIGQDRPVLVHRLVAEGTVEERILLLQERKRSLAEAALGAAGEAASITRHELLELLA